MGEHRSSYISDAAFLREANNARLELYEKLISAGASDYVEETHTWDVESDKASYPLPGDFFKCLGVDITLANNDKIQVPRYTRPERNAFHNPGGRELTYYRLAGDDITLMPTPNWSGSSALSMIYAPVPPDLVEDSDTVDGVCGWEDWIVYKCLVLFAAKEESDPSVWVGLLNQLDRRIDAIKTRDRANPGRIRDVDREDINRIWPSFGDPP